MKIKYPLLMVDSDGTLRRIYYNHIERVKCPYGNISFCSYYCAVIAAFDNGTDLPGLICQSHGRNVPIGFADPESFDIDKLEALMNGSLLLEQIEKQKQNNSSE